MYFHLDVECLYHRIILNELLNLFLPMAVSSLMPMLGGYGFGVPELELEGGRREIRKVGEILERVKKLFHIIFLTCKSRESRMYSGGGRRGRSRECCANVRCHMRRKRARRGEGDIARGGRIKEKLVKFHSTLVSFVFSTQKKKIVVTGQKRIINVQIFHWSIVNATIYYSFVFE